MIDVSAFAKKNGFIWGPEPEIYGGIAGFYTFGPMGKLLKDNVENSIRYIFRKAGFWEIESPIVLPEIVWKASGHLGGFVDPLIRCKKCKGIYRADKIIEEKHDVPAGSWPKKKLLDFIQDKGLRCPKCNGDFLPKIEDYNLMMKTTIELDKSAFNRPETATSTYLSFPNYFEFFRKKLPIKVFQIGKAFRNEISPRQNVLRGREFTQAEAQVFIKAEDKNDFEDYEKVKKIQMPFWPADYQASSKQINKMTLEQAFKKKWLSTKAYAWCLATAYQFVKKIGIPDERIRIRQHSKDEMAHYASDAWDIEIKTNTFGWVEICGVHDRQNYDLKQHAKHSGKKMQVEGQIPNILEIAFGSDRPTFALIDIFLHEEKVGKDTRMVLKLPPSMAPVQVAVFPLMKRDGMDAKAIEIFEDLSKKGFVAVYDGSGSIGKRYRRQDERGSPWCITVDYDTLKDNTVTVRERDSMKQSRVKIDQLAEYLKF